MMDWVRGKKLGHGSSATVSMAVSRVGSTSLPPLMAVKSCGASLSSSLVNEILVLQELGGVPEIIRCFGGGFSFERGERLYNVLLEYASGGTLADRVEKYGDWGLPEMEVRRHTRAMLRGLSHVHGSGYVHCDVKLRNMLLCADGGVRIADFGLARRAGGADGGFDLRGTPMYMSPEMVTDGEQAAPADVWALGCAVAEMAGGGLAWENFRFSNPAALMMIIGMGDQVPEAPVRLSDEGRDFLEKCFVRDPRRRWTAEMLLSHPFVCGDADGAAAWDGGKNLAVTAPTSPKCIFDYPEWVSDCEPWSTEEASSKTAARLGGLVCEPGSDWSVSDDWVTVR